MSMIDLLPGRIQRKIQVTGTGCWEWAGYCEAQGYGRVSHAGASCYAHRVVYELIVGAIPAAHDLHHDCDNAPCVNPAHLTPVTKPDHGLLDGGAAVNRAKTHCPRGHSLADAIRRSNGRYCRTCDNERQRVRYQRRKRA